MFKASGTDVINNGQWCCSYVWLQRCQKDKNNFAKCNTKRTIKSVKADSSFNLLEEVSITMSHLLNVLQSQEGNITLTIASSCRNSHASSTLTDRSNWCIVSTDYLPVCDTKMIYLIRVFAGSELGMEFWWNTRRCRNFIFSSSNQGLTNLSPYPKPPSATTRRYAKTTTLSSVFKKMLQSSHPSKSPIGQVTVKWLDHNPEQIFARMKT